MDGNDTAPHEDRRVHRIVQLTDPHLFAAAGERLKGVDTDRSLRAVVDAVAALDPLAELVLVTGDIAQDESAGAYERLAGILVSLGLPALCLPGNHDDPELMRRHLPGALTGPGGARTLGRWTLLLLSTHVPGEVEGELGPAALDLLEGGLQAADREGRPALVAFHHPPFPLSSRWIDAMGLRRPGEVLAVLDRHQAPRLGIYGHVHQESELRRNGVLHATTPSTCVQFAPGRDTFALDPLPPGFRVVDLASDGGFATRVHRVPAAWEEPEPGHREP